MKIKLTGISPVFAVYKPGYKLDKYKQEEDRFKRIYAQYESQSKPKEQDSEDDNHSLSDDIGTHFDRKI